MWGFPELGVPPNGWFIRENRTKMDDLGVPPFQETSIYTYISLSLHGSGSKPVTPSVHALPKMLVNVTMFTVSSP